MKKVYLLAAVMIFAAAISGCKKGEEAPAAQSANAPKAVETAQASQTPQADVLKETQD